MSKNMSDFTVEPSKGFLNYPTISSITIPKPVQIVAVLLAGLVVVYTIYKSGSKRWGSQTVVPPPSHGTRKPLDVDIATHEQTNQLIVKTIQSLYFKFDYSKSSSTKISTPLGPIWVSYDEKDKKFTVFVDSKDMRSYGGAACSELKDRFGERAGKPQVELRQQPAMDAALTGQQAVSITPPTRTRAPINVEQQNAADQEESYQQITREIESLSASFDFTKPTYIPIETLLGSIFVTFNKKGNGFTVFVEDKTLSCSDFVCNELKRVFQEKAGTPKVVVGKDLPSLVDAQLKRV